MNMVDIGGTRALSRIAPDTSLVLIGIALFVVGVGLGVNTAPLNGVAVAAVPPNRSGTAPGVLNTARMVGATLGVAILASIFAAYAGQDAAMGPAFLPGLRAALTGSGAAELLGAVIAFAFIKRSSLEEKG